jgi:transmembrane sensor
MEEEKFRQIIDRYLAGDASEVERAWLESAYINWNNKDLPQHSETALKVETEKVRDLLLSATMPQENEVVAHNTALLRQPLQQHQITSQKLKIKKWLPLISAAALIIISLSGIFIYRQNNPSSYLTDLPAQADLKAGKDRAVLVLGNGKRIDLDQKASGHLADETGVYISKTADGQLIYTVSEQAELDDKTEYNTVITPAGGQYQINLPDGTKVWLNAASSLSFPTKVTVARSVKLSGEAYFEVSKLNDEGKRIPFVVETASQKIEVLGTHFNVNAYNDENSVRTTLLEGSIKINELTVLKPGQQARVQGGSMQVFAVNGEDYTDWQRGDFMLEHNDFRSVMRKIARWYDVDVVYTDDAPEKLNLGGWISRSKNISSILQVMEKTGKVHFKIEGRRITVTR